MVSDSFGLDFLLWLSFVEEFGFRLLRSWGLFSGKVFNVEFGDIDTFNRNVGGGGNDVRALTLLKGTPLTLNGPETNKVLSSKFFK